MDNWFFNTHGRLIVITRSDINKLCFYLAKKQFKREVLLNEVKAKHSGQGCNL